MNSALFRFTLKSNWIINVIFILVILGYLLLSILMYNPVQLKNLEALLAIYPPELMATVGMDKVPVSLVDFIAVYIYDFLVKLLLIILCIILPLRLMVRFVDRGSMSYLLSTSNSRQVVAITQALYMAASLAITVFLIAGGGIMASALIKPGALDIAVFLELNLTAFLLASSMAAIGFFFSCLWDNMQPAATSVSLLLFFFFTLTSIGKFGRHQGAYGIIERFSIFHLMDTRAIVNGEVNMAANSALLLFIAVMFTAGAVIVFKEKDLSI